MRDLCRGVPDEYLEFHGADEFVALGSEVRAEADRGRRVHLGPREPGGDGPTASIDGLLRRARRLRKATPLAGWAWAGSRSTGPRSLAVTLASPDGRVELILDGDTARFELLDGTTPAQAHPLVEAVSAVLGGARQRHGSSDDGLG